MNTVTCVFKGEEVEREVDYVERIEGRMGMTHPVLREGEMVQFVIGDMRPHIYEVGVMN